MKAEWIKSSGERKSVSPDNGTDFSLEELRRFVGGHIEVVWLGERIMVVNEEGKVRGLPYNPQASMTLLSHGYADSVAGDVLLCDRDMVR